MTSEYVRKVCAEKYEWLAAAGDPAVDPEAYLSRLRTGYDNMAGPMSEHVTVERREIGGVPGLWITPPNPTGPTIVYFHGGGLVNGSSISHGPMVAQVCLRARCEAFVPDYRLAPEFVFPAQLDDARAVYQALVPHQKSSCAVVIGGDSSGAGLALSLVLSLRDENYDLPAAVFTISAQTDWTSSGHSLVDRASLDPFVSKPIAEQMADTACPDLSARTRPLASAVFGDYTGFPPLLMQLGTSEALYDDSARIAARAEADGVDVTFSPVQGMVHVFHLFWDDFPEAVPAMDEIGAFIARNATATTPGGSVGAS